MAITASRRIAACILQSRYLNNVSWISTSPVEKQIKKTSEAKSNLSATSPPLDSSVVADFLSKSCGLSRETAFSVSQKTNFDFKKMERAESVVSTLKSYGFSESQIAKLVRSNPLILFAHDIDSKLRFLAESGFKGSLLPDIFVSHPFILLRSVDSHLKPALEFLKKYTGSQDRVVAALKNSSWVLKTSINNIVQPNVDYLMNQGVTAEIISDLFVLSPRVIIQRSERIVYGVEKLRSLGIPPNSCKFLHAFRAVLALNEANWEKKFQLFKSFGWSDEEVISAFTRDPFCMNCSDEKLKKNVDLFSNKLKMDRQVVIRRPRLLMLNSGRLLGIYEVTKILVSKGLLKQQLPYLFSMSEKRFLNGYVNKNLDKVPNLLELYLSKLETAEEKTRAMLLL